MNEEDIKAAMAKVGDEAMVAVADILPKYMEILDHIGLEIDELTTSSLKKIIKAYVIHPKPVEFALSKKESVLFNHMIELKDMDFQLALAAIFLDKKETPVENK
jgi:hypothetical protein